jgi:hypothetical protein
MQKGYKSVNWNFERHAKKLLFWDLRMIIEGTSIKNQMYIETLSFSAVFQNICFNRL